MRGKSIKTIAIAISSVVASTLSAQELKLSGGNEYQVGETVSITYSDAPSGSQIEVYHNLSILPLKDKYKTKSSSGTFTIDAELQPGTYNAKLISGTTELASAKFTVAQREIPKTGKRIFVISDIHVLSPDLIEDPTNSNIIKAMSNERKLVEKSYDIFCTYIETIKEMKPDMVLIPGDLTKDGELYSHQAVAAKLQELVDAGIPTYVLPGNHDLENGGSRFYTTNGLKVTPNIMPEDFPTLYANFGYGNGSDRDPASLSYACEPIEGIRLICIDDCRTPSRGETDKDAGEYGRITQPTIDWMLDQADKATAEGKVPIAAVHHQMLQHYVGQDSLMSSAATEQGEAIARLMADHGIRVVLTGHMHIPNITRISGSETDGTITEISSASTIAYPSQYRVLWINDEQTEMTVYTVDMPSATGINDLQQAVRDKMESTLDASMSSLALRYMSTFQKMLNDFSGIPEFANLIDDVPEDPNELSAIAIQAFGKVIREVIYTTSEGNEQLKDASKVVLAHLEEGCKDACDIVFDNQSEQSKAFLAYSMYVYMLELGEPTILSMLSDTSYMGTPDANQTDDFYLTIKLKDNGSGITQLPLSNDGTSATYSITGQKLGNATQKPHGIYIIRNGNKVMKVLR